MPELYIHADCPRCGKKEMTFDAKSSNDISEPSGHSLEEIMDNIPPDPWRGEHELFAICRNCKKATVFIIVEPYDDIRDDFPNWGSPMEREGSLNKLFKIDGILRVPDDVPRPPPEFLDKNIEQIFNEGAMCISKECWNAAVATFRLCLDLTTKDLISKEDLKKSNDRPKDNLASRVDWLFEKDKLPARLKDVADCIRKYGNDGVHDGTLTKADAEALFDFTTVFLEEVYTGPRKTAKMKEKRKKPAKSNKPIK